MIRHDPLITQLRFYIDESLDPYAQYDAICTLQWESKEVVWIKGFNGKLTRNLIRELGKFLIDSGIKKIKATRADGKTLPFVSHRDEHYIEIDTVTDKTLRWLARLK